MIYIKFKNSKRDLQSIAKEKSKYFKITECLVNVIISIQ